MICEIEEKEDEGKKNIFNVTKGCCQTDNDERRKLVRDLERERERGRQGEGESLKKCMRPSGITTKKRRFISSGFESKTKKT